MVDGWSHNEMGCAELLQNAKATPFFTLTLCESSRCDTACAWSGPHVSDIIAFLCVRGIQ